MPVIGHGYDFLHRPVISPLELVAGTARQTVGIRAMLEH